MDEIRIYSIPQSEYNEEMTDDEFVDKAEEAGTVYSLKGFLSNLKEVNTEDVFRAYVIKNSRLKRVDK